MMIQPFTLPHRVVVTLLLGGFTAGIGLGALLCDRAAKGDAWTVAAELLGLPVGTVAPALPAGPSIDAAALAEPAVLTDAAAKAAVAERVDRLRDRYDAWLSAREPVAYLEAHPELPTEAGFPPLPDAPDGEVTREREALAAEVLR